MIFSFSTLLSTIIINAVFVGMLFILINTRLISYRNIHLFLLSTAVILVRFLLPFEFPFTLSIPVGRVLPSIYDIFNTTLFTHSDHSVNLFQILIILWFSGCAILSVKVIINYKNTARNLSAYEPPKDFVGTAVLKEVNEKYRQPKEIKLLLTNETISPIIFGIKEPTIIVPNINFSAKEWHYILTHETTHYYSHHLYYKLLCEILHIMYFWNPLTKLFIKQINRVLEISTNSKVVSSLTSMERIEYSECLLKMTKKKEASKAEPVYAATLIAGKPLSISQRIYLIVESPKRERNFSSHVVASFLILIALLIFSLFFVFEPYRIPAKYESGTYELQQDNTYMILNEDGTYDLYSNSEYIITVDEIFDDQIPVITR